MRIPIRKAKQFLPIVLFSIVLISSLISFLSVSNVSNSTQIRELNPSNLVNFPHSKDDIAMASLIRKCHEDVDSTISSNSFTTGDYETRKKDWLSSCYPIEISSSARSVGHCTGIFI